ncbi:MAG: HipA domain-containing protein, partial [Myxococcota bacterium]|nr:HipA domain-containing protein [Myxococcota bacterium]
PSRDDFRISLAGAQEKTGFLWHEGAWHRPVGATPTTHIFKLPIGSVQGMDLGDSVENEWLCLRIAKELGFRVPEAEIATFEDTKALVVERFDRRFSDDGRYVRRLPQEDFCQALGVAPARKYEVDGGPGIADCMELLQQSLDPLADRSTFLRAALFYWLLGAIDGHAKNFSFFLYPGGRCKLTPLYDVLSAYPLVGSGELALQRLKMAMAVKGTSRHYRWDGIRARHWISTAKHCRYPEARVQAILDELGSAIPSAIDRVGASLPAGFPGDVAGPVLEKLATASGKLASP